MVNISVLIKLRKQNSNMEVILWGLTPWGLWKSLWIPPIMWTTGDVSNWFACIGGLITSVRKALTSAGFCIRIFQKKCRYARLGPEVSVLISTAASTDTRNKVRMEPPKSRNRARTTSEVSARQERDAHSCMSKAKCAKTTYSVFVHKDRIASLHMLRAWFHQKLYRWLLWPISLHRRIGQIKTFINLNFSAMAEIAKRHLFVTVVVKRVISQHSAKKREPQMPKYLQFKWRTQGIRWATLSAIIVSRWATMQIGVLKGSHGRQYSLFWTISNNFKCGRCRMIRDMSHKRCYVTTKTWDSRRVQVMSTKKWTEFISNRRLS